MTCLPLRLSWPPMSAAAATTLAVKTGGLTPSLRTTPIIAGDAGGTTAATSLPVPDLFNLCEQAPSRGFLLCEGRKPTL